MKGNDLKNELTKSYDKLRGLVCILEDLDFNNIGLSLKDSVENSEFCLCEDDISSSVKCLRSAFEHFIKLEYNIRNRNYE